MELKDIHAGDIIRLKGFIHIPKTGGHISHSEWNMDKHGYINLGEYEIVFVVPEGFSHSGSTEMDTINQALIKARQEFNDKVAILKGRKRDLELAAELEANNVPNP